MTDDEFNKQRNMFGRMVTFNIQLDIGPLNYEITAFDLSWRYSQQKQKMLEKKLLWSYAENLNLRESLYSRLVRMQAQPDGQPTTDESAHPNIPSLPNTNACCETLKDVLAFLDKNSSGIKSTKQSFGSHPSDVAQQSLDPVGEQVVREQVVTEQFSTKSLVFVTLRIFVAFAFLNFALSTIALNITTIVLPQYHILTITLSSNNDVPFALNSV